MEIGDCIYTKEYGVSVKIPDMKERILMNIGKEPVPIYEIAKKAGVCITTTSKYIYILQAEKKVEIRSFGNMKLVKRKT